jgi:diaminopimelate decarboxylase
MFNKDFTKRFSALETPFYFYDLELLKRTIKTLKQAAGDYHVHYALKANAHPVILELINDAGFGADCVSGNEVLRAAECGFEGKKIVFAGVGKTDKEINQGFDRNIFCFNVESKHELEVINGIAASRNIKAPVALRVNPNVDAYTHNYITTGLEENKFGINPYEFSAVLDLLAGLKNLEFSGLHFHIGSQIQDLAAFRNLCSRVNEINRWFHHNGSAPQHLNVGGGLGINYLEPDTHAVVDFESYFGIFRKNLQPLNRQGIHFELGRSVVGQCGSLISRVLYIKNGVNTNFAILDAGMTELIRPALYQAYHKIENLSNSDAASKKYDVVGPICESSDCFGKAVELPETKRGDLVAIRSAGAYGEVMSNRYNLREGVRSVFS